MSHKNTYGQKPKSNRRLKKGHRFIKPAMATALVNGEVKQYLLVLRGIQNKIGASK